ncbi:VOC family protein [Arvimicrobium flavum]|uniref:VOC family protein n=1 Tax=Arvimicrobium flavum TaxID=3393320 RepID=UPI00237A7459|nr:VOC family protein [Mesorhizobium shangrilense]
MPLKISNVSIILNVTDVDRTEKFYRENLGFEFMRTDEPDGSSWLLARIGSNVEVLVFPGDPKPGNTPGVVFGLSEGGIDTVLASLASRGVEIVTPVSEAPGGWFADFRDPDGHIVSFYQAENVPRTSG